MVCLKIIQSNLKEVWEATPLSYLQKGKEWYPKANKLAQILSIQYKKNFNQICGIISALSPQKSWDKNVEIVKNFLETGNILHTQIQSNKVLKIMETTNTEYIMNILGGRKTINFFRNILEPKNTDYITIDYHMLNMMTFNFRLKKCTPIQYDYYKQEFLTFSKKINHHPIELQSSLWEYFRQAKWGKI